MFDLKSYFTGLAIGIAVFAASDYATDTAEIELSDREANAIEHGVPDQEVAKSLGKKLTEEFGQSGFTVEVIAPEAQQGNTPQAGPAPN